MANLKELRSRIKSTNSTKRITSAMKMVAAAKLRRAEEEVARARPYFHRMMGMLTSTRDTTSHVDIPIFTHNPDAPKILVVTISTDRGLCGPLNSNVFKKVLALSKEHKSKQCDFITVGRKGSDYIKRNIGTDSLLVAFDHLNAPTPNYKGACLITEKVLSTLDSGDYGQCVLYYSRFVSAIEQKVEQISLMPFGTNEQEAENSAQPLHVVYEPNLESVLQSVIKKALETTIYTSLLESFASEQGARMTAMDNANRNAGEMIDKLTITYNRSRQANITNELIEVISGAAAV